MHWQRVALLTVLPLVGLPHHIGMEAPGARVRVRLALEAYIQLGHPKDPGFCGRPLEYWRLTCKTGGVKFVGPVGEAVVTDGPHEILIEHDERSAGWFAQLLLALAADPEASVRRIAARGLGTYHGSSEKLAVVGALVQMVSDPNREVRWEAARALSRFGWSVLGWEVMSDLVDPVLNDPAESPEPSYPFGIAPVRPDELGLLQDRSYPLTIALTSAVNDADLERIAQYHGLHSLWLRNGRITDAGLKHLRALKDLRVLDLTGTLVTDDGLRTLTELPHLKVLYLRNTLVTPAGVARLMLAAPQLEITH